MTQHRFDMVRGVEAGQAAVSRVLCTVNPSARLMVEASHGSNMAVTMPPGGDVSPIHGLSERSILKTSRRCLASLLLLQ